MLTPQLQLYLMLLRYAADIAVIVAIVYLLASKPAPPPRERQPARRYRLHKAMQTRFKVTKGDAGLYEVEIYT